MASANSSSDRITLYGVRQIGQRESNNIAEKVLSDYGIISVLNRRDAHHCHPVLQYSSHRPVGDLPRLSLFVLITPYEVAEDT